MRRPRPEGIPMRGKHIIQWLFDAATWFVLAIAVLTFVLRLQSGSNSARYSLSKRPFKVRWLSGTDDLHC